MLTAPAALAFIDHFPRTATREEKLAALRASRGKDDSEETRQKNAEKVIEMKQKVCRLRLSEALLSPAMFQEGQ